MPDKAIPMTAPPDVYRQRRARLGSAIRRPMVLLAGEPRARQYATNTHPFRAASNYLYFGGPPLPAAALCIEPGNDGCEGCTLIRAVPEFEETVWIGQAPSDEELARVAGLTVASLIAPDSWATQVKDRPMAFLAPPCPRSLDWARSLGVQEARRDELQPIVDMRLIKDEHELAAMRQAARVGMEAHRAAMKAAQPGRRESDVAAAFGAVLVARQCNPSFTPIVTVHGEVLHSDTYPHALETDRLLLVDAGAEEPGGYASDITRTYPVNGRWTSIQRHLYDTVLHAQRESMAACVPGRRFRDIHDLAARILCEGLVDAQLLRGEPAELAARLAHTLFFTHGLGHLIGLDVHDMEDFGDLAGYPPGRTRRPEFGNKYLRLDRDLAPGMTVTIEPGLYLVPAVWQREDLVAPFADVVNRKIVDALLAEQFGGIRIEDTVCVRAQEESSPEVLTAELPTDADAIAAMVNAPG